MSRKKRRQPAAILPETAEEPKTNEQIVIDIQVNGDPHGEKMLYLMKRNKGFCFKVCLPFINSGQIEPEEVKSISFLALSDVVNRHKPDDKISFLTMLKYTLLREIIETIDGYAMFSLPGNLRSTLNRYKHYCSEYVTHHGEPPPDAAILKELRISQNTLSLLKIAERSQQAPISLDEPMYGTGVDTEGDDLLLIDALPDTKTPSTEQTVIDGLLRKTLLEEISALPDEERKAVEGKYLHKISTDEKAVRRGIAILGKSSQLRAFANDNLFAGTGFSNFSRTWSSQPEKAVIRMNDK